MGMLLLPAVASAALCDATPVTLSSFGSPSLSNGCFASDQSFSNFVTTNNAGSSPTESNSTTDIATVNTYSSVTDPWTVTDTLTPASAADWRVSGAAGNLGAGTEFVTNTQQTYITGIFQPVPTPGDAIYLDSVSLVGVGVSGDGIGVLGDNMEASIDFCIGSAPCGLNNVVALNVDWGNNTSVPTAYTCSVDAGVAAYFSCGASTSSSPITITFLQPIATLNVSEFYSLTSNRGTVQLDSLKTIWGSEELPTGADTSAPEPSSFLLIATGIAAALLRARRRA